MSHTPGPWEWHSGWNEEGTKAEAPGNGNSGLFGADGKAVLQGCWCNDGTADVDAPNDADALLIAAAPQLLAALKAMLDGELGDQVNMGTSEAYAAIAAACGEED